MRVRAWEARLGGGIKFSGMQLWLVLISAQGLARAEFPVR